MTKFLRAILATLFMAVVAPAGVWAQEAAPSATRAVEAEIPTAPVKLDERTLFRVRGTSSYPAAERAAAISGRLVEVAADASISPESIVIEPGPVGLVIRADKIVIANLIPADAVLESVQLPTLAQVHRQRIRQAITEYRAERDPDRLLRGALLSLLATGLFVLLVYLSGALFRRLSGLLEQRVRAHVETLPKGAFQFVQGRQIWEATAATVRGVHRILLVVLVYLWLQFVLGEFPWTRWLSEQLLALLISPLVRIGTGLLDYLPSLLFLIVLALVTRYGLRLVKLYFSALERGTATLANFSPDWALPAYKIVRTVLIALALVMAYPYLPGSGSEALQGISVFAGLMFSLGASGAVSNVIAGYFNTFGRVFRVGDVIQVGEVRGEVTQVRLLTTRVRTIKNEEITIPNSVIISTHLINYSALAASDGLVLHTEVGIGYEVPWRQVHAMLEEAARRTPGLLPDKAPFILQRQLGDFAVVYQLNVYSGTVKGMAQTYSNLHQNILDVFNEHAVQIMTPAYEGDPQVPKIVPREQWHVPPAEPPTKSGQRPSPS